MPRRVRSSSHSERRRGAAADSGRKSSRSRVMQMAVFAFLAPFWALPTMLLSGGSAAVGIALVNAIGNVGGFIGPNVIGFLRTRTGGDTGAFLVLAAMAFVASPDPASRCSGSRRCGARRQRNSTEPLMSGASRRGPGDPPT